MATVPPTLPTFIVAKYSATDFYGVMKKICPDRRSKINFSQFKKIKTMIFLGKFMHFLTKIALYFP